MTLASLSALVAKGSNNESKHKDKKKKEECTYCSIPGHKEEDCRKKKRAEEEATKNSTATDNLTAKAVHSTNYRFHSESLLQLFVASTPGTETPTSSNWIVDSGAMANMTCQQEILTSYCTFTQPERVTIGYGRPIDAIRIGCVTLQVHVGNGNYKHTIL